LNNQTTSSFKISKEISSALNNGLPVVALESTVITHGLPYPQNYTLALDLESIIRQELEGQVYVGLEQGQIANLVESHKLHKISVRDFPAAIINGWSGGTTVAATLKVAHDVNIRVFATGGIGGVHRNPPFDVSTDLIQLARTPLVVVCSGAKAILDLPATLEVLETYAIPVVGYQVDEFPAFYARTSGLNTSSRVDTTLEAAKFALAHWKLGLPSAILLVNPVPEETALLSDRIEHVIQQALLEAETLGIRGQGVTPFLLKRVGEISGGESLKANLDLLRSNAKLAAKVARQLAG